MMKHSPYDLKQMQSLPLEAKIIMSQRRIKEWYDYWNGDVYIGFSGGKDSTVLKHLAETTNGVHDIPSLFINTGLEYPEIQKFAISQPNVITVRPEMRFDEVLRSYGYPVVSKEVAHKVGTAQRNGKGCSTYRYLDGTATKKDGTPSNFNHKKWGYLVDCDFRISDKCCDIMKKKPAHLFEKETGRKAIIGTLAEESSLRYAIWLKEGCNSFDSCNPISKPLSFWTEQDILEYIKRFKLPYCSVYGDLVEVEEGKLSFTGCNRTGCIFCMFGCHFDKNPNRFQRLKETHPRQYEYCINGGGYVDGFWKPNEAGLGLAHVLEVVGVKYEWEDE